MSYARALERLRTLGLANNALDMAIEQAVDDLVASAQLERLDRASGIVGPLCSPRGVTGSGIRRKDPNLERRIGAVEVERYVRGAWEGAKSEEDFERVRSLVRRTVESGMLEDEGAERLVQLIAA